MPASLPLPSCIEIARLRRGEMPIYEPDLRGLVAANTAAGQLAFTTERMPAIEGGDAVFIAVDTPRARRGGNSGITKQPKVEPAAATERPHPLFHL
jgi:UDP-glucose 6-dehydrogenase